MSAIGMGHALGVLLARLPLALDGEAAASGDTGLAIVSVVSMVFGYLLLAGLWYFVFREKARGGRKRGPDD